MAHDVFISHSAKDKTIADAVCATLESQGIRCWIAPRDILPGAVWSASIVDAIAASRVMVLIFSSNVNVSPPIRAEIEQGFKREIPIIPFRIENVVPGKNLEFFLSGPHWLDAYTEPLGTHLRYLTEVVQRFLETAPPQPLDERTAVLVPEADSESAGEPAKTETAVPLPPPLTPEPAEPVMQTEDAAPPQQDWAEERSDPEVQPDEMPRHDRERAESLSKPLLRIFLLVVLACGVAGLAVALDYWTSPVYTPGDIQTFAGLSKSSTLADAEKLYGKHQGSIIGIDFKEGYTWTNRFGKVWLTFSPGRHSVDVDCESIPAEVRGRPELALCMKKLRLKQFALASCEKTGEARIPVSEPLSDLQKMSGGRSYVVQCWDSPSVYLDSWATRRLVRWHGNDDLTADDFKTILGLTGTSTVEDAVRLFGPYDAKLDMTVQKKGANYSWRDKPSGREWLSFHASAWKSIKVQCEFVDRFRNAAPLARLCTATEGEQRALLKNFAPKDFLCPEGGCVGGASQGITVWIRAGSVTVTWDNPALAPK